MINKVNVLIVCLLLVCVACSGKSGAKMQAEGNVSEAGHSVNAKTAEKAVRSSTGTDSATESVDLQMIYASDADREIFEKYLAHIEKLESFQESELIIETARFFLGRPYVAHTLEMEPEGLVINLSELDCTTLVEIVFALSRTVARHENPTFEDFCRQLQNIRYRRGTINDYTDRIHYFSDWIYENETRGHVRDVTKEIGGEPYKVKVGYMSSHPDSYKQLKSNAKYVDVTKKKEAEISARDVYAFIPETKIKSCEEGMKDGDILCFVTNVEGLDIAHVGYVYREKGVVKFIHASSLEKKVVIDKLSIYGYVEKSKSVIGVMILRPRFLK